VRSFSIQACVPHIFRDALVLLALSLLLLVLAYGLAHPRYSVNVGGPFEWGAVSAFGSPEQNREASFRWSAGRAALHVFGLEGRPGLLELRLSATRPAAMPEAQLSISRDGRPLGRWHVAREWRRYAFLLPPTPRSEQTLLLRSTVFEPGGRDERRLGVALDRLRVVASGSWPSPPMGRWLFLALLPVLLYLGLRALGRPGFRLGLLLTLALAAAYAWAPSALAYLLPSLWPTAGLLGLGLALHGARVALLVRWPELAERNLLLVVALLLLLVGLALLAWEFWPAGLALGLPGALVLALVFPGSRQPATGNRQQGLDEGKGQRREGKGEGLLLAAIVLLALGLRLWQLDQVPLGIWQDEARHGMGALRVLSNPDFRPVYATDVDLPALIFYTIVPSFATFGVSSWSLRLPMVLAGALLPLALFFLARPLLGRGAALIAALLAAVATWGLSLSRIAWPTIFDPLLLALGLGLLWRALHARRAWAALLLGAGAGLLVGLDGYTYHTGRLAPLFGLWLLLVAALAQGPERELPRGRLSTVAGVWLLALALTLLPLLLFAAEDPQGFTKRVGGVSLFSSSVIESGSPALRVERNGLRYLGMLHLRGDQNGRHHLPGRPLLDPLVGALWLLGLLWAVHNLRATAARLLLGWLALGLAAGVFSLGGPHAMRAVGALVPSLMLAGLGMRELFGWLGLWSARLRGRRHFQAGLLVAACCLAVLAYNSWLYFGVMPRDARHLRAFRPVATRLGLEAREWALQEARPQVYLTQAQLSSDETRLFTLGIANIAALEDARSPVSGGGVLLLAATSEPRLREAALARLGLHGAAVIPGDAFPDTGEPMYYVYLRREN
jgi:4-amino-4-deoxy-L-arabinose transferase-like glycosyltransferase